MTNLDKETEEYVRTLRFAGINIYNHCDIEKAYKSGFIAMAKKILEEMENRALSGVSATTLRNIFKDLGIEL